MADMSQHTSGPWQIHTENGHCSWTIEVKKENMRIASIKRRRPFTEEEIANAALIAVAPQLLAAAKGLFETLNQLINPGLIEDEFLDVVSTDQVLSTSTAEHLKSLWKAIEQTGDIVSLHPLLKENLSC